MDDSLYMIFFGFALAALGGAIVSYLVSLLLNFLMDGRKEKRKDPDYVKEINGKLVSNNVETERDLF